jgi:hypothetical protein
MSWVTKVIVTLLVIALIGFYSEASYYKDLTMRCNLACDPGFKPICIEEETPLERVITCEEGTVPRCLFQVTNDELMNIYFNESELSMRLFNSYGGNKTDGS